MSISGDFPPTGEGGDTAGWSGSPEDDASLETSLIAFPLKTLKGKFTYLKVSSNS